MRGGNTTQRSNEVRQYVIESIRLDGRRKIRGPDRAQSGSRRRADELKQLMDEMTASEAKSNDSLEEMFGEPISVYPDAEAVEDGFLVSFTGPGDSTA